MDQKRLILFIKINEYMICYKINFIKLKKTIKISE